MTISRIPVFYCEAMVPDPSKSGPLFKFDSYSQGDLLCTLKSIKNAPVLYQPLQVNGGGD